MAKLTLADFEPYVGEFTAIELNDDLGINAEQGVVLRRGEAYCALFVEDYTAESIVRRARRAFERHG